MYQQQYGGNRRGAIDPVAARQKEEQRRRQQAYAQALAQQVQQREVQKQREKAIERQGTSHGRQGQGHGPGAGYPDAHHSQLHGKDLFDGFGQKENQSRTNFARGQRSQPQQYPPRTPHFEMNQHQQRSPMRHDPMSGSRAFPEPRDPFEFLHNNSNNHDGHPHHVGGAGFNDVGIPMHSNPHLFAQPHHLKGMPPPPVPSMGSNAFNDVGGANSNWGVPPMMHRPPPFGFPPERMMHAEDTPMAPMGFNPQHPMDGFPQHVDPHQQQQASPNHHRGGRRLRADGIIDDDKARRKFEQQQQVQNALQQQVEEKKRQKLEAKRRQEEEDRKEVERFEAEQRRMKQDEERAKEEKRRKAGEELVRAQHAASALADHHKKAQQQQQRSPQKLNPFPNSRAHLFEDPPSPSPERHLQNIVAKAIHQQEHGHSNQEYVHQQVHDAPYRQSFQQQQDPHLPPHAGFTLQTHERERSNGYCPPPHEMPPHVDPSILLRQYDEMKEELLQQRQLVDQLRQAHAEIQQLQQQRHPSPVPTLSDLEQLRHELREELEHREHMHRQELEIFKRQQQQKSPMDHCHRTLCQQDSPLKANSHEVEPRRQTDRQMTNQQHSSPLQHQKTRLPSEIERSIGSSSVQQTTCADPASEELELRSHAALHPISGKKHSTSVASLQCDSKLVYFDGQVRPQQEDALTESTAAPSRKKHIRRIVPELELDLEDSMDHLIAQVDVPQSAVSQKLQGSSIGASQRPSSQTPDLVGNNQEETPETKTVSAAAKHHKQEGEDGEESDSLAFFVKDFRDNLGDSPQLKSSLLTPTRAGGGATYRYASSVGMDDLSSSWDPSPLLQQSRNKWLHAFDDEDEDDELNASLDGDELEAIFQRNVRRHEILLGFQQAKSSDSPSAKQEKRPHFPPVRVMAWTQLHQQLEEVAATSAIAPLASAQRNSSSKKTATQSGRTNQSPEDPLVASSRWMPSLHTNNG